MHGNVHLPVCQCQSMSQASCPRQSNTGLFSLWRAASGCRGNGRVSPVTLLECRWARVTCSLNLSRSWPQGLQGRGNRKPAPRPFGGPLADSRASRSPGGGDPGRKDGGPAPEPPPAPARPLPPAAAEGGRAGDGPPVVAAAPLPPAAVRCCSLDARLTAVSWSPPYTSSRHTLSCRPYRPSYGAGLRGASVPRGQ